ncbi:MAG: proline racemase family protein [Bilophila wadsworthia]
MSSRTSCSIRSRMIPRHLPQSVVFCRLLDRSPCRTAPPPCGLAKGELGLNEAFVHESVIGTQFRARIVSPQWSGRQESIPEVSGSAYVTGLLKLVIDPADPLRHGFRLA